MTVLIRSMQPGDHFEEYLAWYDPDWQPPDAPPGLRACGLARWTPDPAKAMTFPTVAAAAACWQMQSVRIPIRYDGQPNRPLTAYTIELVRAEELSR